MKKHYLFPALLFVLNGLCIAQTVPLNLAPVASITGITISPATPGAGDQLTYTVSADGGRQCGARAILSGPQLGQGDELILNRSNLPGASGKVTVAAEGSYSIKITPSAAQSSACKGSANIAFVVAPKSVGTVKHITVTPDTPAPGETVKYTFSTEGTGRCQLYVLTSGPGGSVAQDALVNLTPNGGGSLELTAGIEGTYTIKADDSGKVFPKCKGAIATSFTVKKVAIAILTPPAACPAPYVKRVDGVDQARGEYYCERTAPTCPAGGIPQVLVRGNQARFSCVTNLALANCPDGWTGAKAKGTLTCDSISQPKIVCPTSAAWQWGATYYTESWNKMGCRANPKPAF
jgi:hypothetical protein